MRNVILGKGRVEREEMPRTKLLLAALMALLTSTGCNSLKAKRAPLPGV